MKTINLRATSGTSKIYTGESLKNLSKYADPGRTFIITDPDVNKLFGDRFSDYKIIEIRKGEENKTLEAVENIYKKLLDCEADRGSNIVGIGGGIVCDITGFVASTYMRGVKFGFVPTTLLSQVDAATGGKNGVNLDRYKNIIGVINQADFVICDTHTLTTLPDKEFNCGLSEVVKSAAIGDSLFFEFLENNISGIIKRDPLLLEKVVHDSLKVKVGIVERDEKESGERRKLNFGHTIAHALERATGITHGDAVSAGMVVAADFSVKRKLLPVEIAGRLKELLSSLNLPLTMDAEKEYIKDAVRKDKKREGEDINFVFLKGIGEAVIEKISVNHMEEIIDDMH